MEVQKRKKKLLTEIFDILECLITQNPTNQDLGRSEDYQNILEKTG